MLNFLIQPSQAKEILEIGNLAIDVSWWPYLFAFVKYFLIFMTVLFIIGIVLILTRIEGSFKIRTKEAIEEAMEAGRLPKTKVQKEWEAVLSNLNSNNSEDYKKAVVSAEELFNRVLKMANFSGSNIEERLKKIPDDQLEFKEDIVWSHKLKEKISNDENFEVDHEEAKRAVYMFERALKEIEII
ncbi:MAG: hypothetical protein KAS78_05835 [Candidatus Pacebacteria bacterium]|nr:hypothetical protein [Candidatus Paceibacterota bacterium]